MQKETKARSALMMVVQMDAPLEIQTCAFDAEYSFRTAKNLRAWYRGLTTTRPSSIALLRAAARQHRNGLQKFAIVNAWLNSQKNRCEYSPT
jgi:hypothetical protein